MLVRKISEGTHVKDLDPLVRGFVRSLGWNAPHLRGGPEVWVGSVRADSRGGRYGRTVCVGATKEFVEQALIQYYANEGRDLTAVGVANLDSESGTKLAQGQVDEVVTS